VKEGSIKRRRSFKESEWQEHLPKNVPQQLNDTDCGVFVCMFAEYLSRGATPTFQQSDMPSFRNMMKRQLLQKCL